MKAKAVAPDKREPPDEEILKDATGDIAKLRRLGVTDFAIITYIVRVREGQPRDQAVRALLEGRSLTGEQEDLVRSVVSRLPLA